MGGVARLGHGLDFGACGIDEQAVVRPCTSLPGLKSHDADSPGVGKSTGVIYEHWGLVPGSAGKVFRTGGIIVPAGWHETITRKHDVALAKCDGYYVSRTLSEGYDASPTNPGRRDSRAIRQPLEAEHVIEWMRPAFDPGANHVAGMHAVGDAVAAVTQRELQSRVRVR